MKKIQRAFFEKMRFYFLYLMKQVGEQEVRLLKEVPLILVEPKFYQYFLHLRGGFKKKNTIGFEICLLICSGERKKLKTLIS